MKLVIAEEEKFLLMEENGYFVCKKTPLVELLKIKDIETILSLDNQRKWCKLLFGKHI